MNEMHQQIQSEIRARETTLQHLRAAQGLIESLIAEKENEVHALTEKYIQAVNNEAEGVTEE